jgi:hypothetical protein
MQFENGEWLKGEIKDLQDESFSFDSDELDDLSLDFGDIEKLYSPRTNTLVFKDKTTVQGSFHIVGDTITVMTAEGEKTYPRDELRAIIPGEMTELNFWSGKLSFGGTIRRGNVNQADISLFARAQRRSPGLRLIMEYNGAYGTVDSVKTANNHRFLLTNDVFLTTRFFLRLPSFEAYKDEFQNIEYRLTPGLLAGYDIIDRPTLEWTMSGGAGYQLTKFFSPPAGAPTSENQAVLLFSTRADWEATPKIDVFGEFSFAYAITGRSNNNVRLTLGTEIEVWGDLDFDIQLIIDRQSNPAPLADGTLPKPDDLRLFFGLGWDF